MICLCHWIQNGLTICFLCASISISPLEVGVLLVGFVGRASSKDFATAFVVISANVGVGRSLVSESGIEPTMAVVSQVYVL